MEKKLTVSPSGNHNRLPNDEVTRNKIDKHLSDIHDTISEEDIKNINTVTGAEGVVPIDNSHDKREADEILKEDRIDNDDEIPEAPTPWEVLGE